jgi:hypothetical protein
MNADKKDGRNGDKNDDRLDHISKQSHLPFADGARRNR